MLSTVEPARQRKKVILLAINSSWNVINFRTGLVCRLVEEGYSVVVAAPLDAFSHQIEALGCTYVEVPMDNKGINPLRDLVLLWRFWRLIRSEKPGIFLGFTVKPNVYGSIAAKLVGVPVINNVTGLGAAFIRGGWLVKVLKTLYRISFGESYRVFFQNRDDRSLFIKGGLVNPQQTDLLPGSGVCLRKFSYKAPVEQSNRKFRFLLVARMLWDKGVGEFVEAGKFLSERYDNVEFCLLGSLDVANPAAISREQMASWVDAGAVNYLGATDDVRPYIASADCIVLPSYREGTPRALLEAAAMGRPLIATDAAGCREVVEDGCNGYLCCVGDARDLAEKMEKMLTLSSDRRASMALEGRKKVESEFDERLVIEKYLAAIGNIA